MSSVFDVGGSGPHRLEILETNYGGPIGNHQRSFKWYYPRALRPSLPQDWGLQPHPKTAIAIVSGMGKAMDCKFDRYIHRVHPNKSPLKIWEKRERGHIQGLLSFLSIPYYFRNG